MATQPGSRVSSMKQQVGHGFARGQPLVYTGGVYAKATAASGFNGVCGTIPDVNRFELVTAGELDGLANLATETTLYLSTAAGVLSTTGTIPVLRASTANTAWVLPQQIGGATMADGIDAAIAEHVAQPDPHSQYVLQSELGGVIAAAGGATGAQIFEAATPAQVRVIIETEPASRTLVYTGDQLTSTSDAYGTQAFSYDVNGRLTGVTGTGKHRSKDFFYGVDGKLTNVVVL